MSGYCQHNRWTLFRFATCASSQAAEFSQLQDATHQVINHRNPRQGLQNFLQTEENHIQRPMQLHRHAGQEQQTKPKHESPDAKSKPWRKTPGEGTSLGQEETEGSLSTHTEKLQAGKGHGSRVLNDQTPRLTADSQWLHQTDLMQPRHCVCLLNIQTQIYIQKSLTGRLVRCVRVRSEKRKAAAQADPFCFATHARNQAAEFSQWQDATDQVRSGNSPGQRLQNLSPKHSL